MSTNTAFNDTDCHPATFVQKYSYLSEFFDHPLYGRDLKIYDSCFAILLIKCTSLSDCSISCFYFKKNNIDIMQIQYLKMPLLLKLSLLQKIVKITPELQISMIIELNFEKKDLIKQIEVRKWLNRLNY